MAADFKQAIDDRIRKLQAIRQFADDPEFMALLREFMGSNGNGHNPVAVVAQPSLIPNGDVRQSRPRRGDQQRMVEEILAEAAEPVDTDGIVARMIAKGYVFAASNPRVAVNECLRYAEKRGRAEVAGKKGLSNLWKTKTKAA